MFLRHRSVTLSVITLNTENLEKALRYLIFLKRYYLVDQGPLTTMAEDSAKLEWWMVVLLIIGILLVLVPVFLFGIAWVRSCCRSDTMDETIPYARRSTEAPSPTSDKRKNGSRSNRLPGKAQHIFTKSFCKLRFEQSKE